MGKLIYRSLPSEQLPPPGGSCGKYLEGEKQVIKCLWHRTRNPKPGSGGLVVWSEPRKGRWGWWEAWLQEAAARLNKYEMQATLSRFSYPFQFGSHPGPAKGKPLTH